MLPDEFQKAVRDIAKIYSEKLSEFAKENFDKPEVTEKDLHIMANGVDALTRISVMLNETFVPNENVQIADAKDLLELADTLDVCYQNEMTYLEYFLKFTKGIVYRFGVNHFADNDPAGYEIGYLAILMKSIARIKKMQEAVNEKIEAARNDSSLKSD